MGKSKKRGGSKEHKQRVEKRNGKIKEMRSVYQKLFDESMRAQIEELKKQYNSGDTETIQISGQ